MRLSLIKLTFISLLILFVSCEKIIPFDNSNFKPKLVINAFNTPDGILEIQFNTSFNLLGEEDTIGTVNPIEIQLFKGNTRIIRETYIPNKGQVFIPILLEENQTYTMEAQTEGFPTITSTDKVPKNIPEIQVDTSLRDIVNYKVNVGISDPLDTNFYVLDVLVNGLEKSTTIDSVYKSYPVVFSSTEKLFLSSFQRIASGVNTAFFEDILFNGNFKTIQLLIPIDNILRPDFKATSFTVRLKSVSSQMFEFYRLLFQNNNAFGGPLYYEGQLEGNINSGLGGFYFYNEQQKEVLIR